jgi:hypothetical protein
MIDILNPSDADRVAAAIAFYNGDPSFPATQYAAGGAGDVITPHGDRWIKTVAEIADRCNDRDELIEALKHYELFIDDAGVAWLISSI